MEILRISNLSFTYPESDIPALDNISMSVNCGQFITIFGPSGCGKTTLLRLIKKELAPHGELKGDIIYRGRNISELDALSSVEIGFVMQRPESQIVTDTVWHELAFGLENMGLPAQIIRSRIAETAAYFGIEDWFNQKTAQLSGGQKQMLNLASVLAMRPRLLLLDEPSAQLDPIGAAELYSALRRLNAETGLTVIMAEHCLQDAFEMSDKIVLMEKGSVKVSAPPEDILTKLKSCGLYDKFMPALPEPVRIFDALADKNTQQHKCPITVRESRDFLASFCRLHEEQGSNKTSAPDVQVNTKSIKRRSNSRPALEIAGASFRYEKDGRDVLKDLSFTVEQGEICCLLGGNGSGKTTLLSIAAGLVRPYEGKVKILGKSLKDYKGNSLYRGIVAMLPQDVMSVFTGDSVEEDIDSHCRLLGLTKAEIEEKKSYIYRLMNIAHLKDRHPADLSGGEQQKCALAKILLSNPQLLLLDEPSKGMDAFAKDELKEILKSLKNEGKTVIIVTHDVEFACGAADVCAMLFNGGIASNGTPRELFAENYYYTTPACRISRGILDGAVTAEEVIKLCRARLNQQQ